MKIPRLSDAMAALPFVARHDKVTIAIAFVINSGKIFNREFEDEIGPQG